MKNTKMMLEGDVTKTLLKISLPIILANILQTVYQLIDTFWVGRLGASAVAAVSLSFPIFFFLSSLAMGLTVAGGILIAQYNGKNDKKNVSLVVANNAVLVIGFSIIVAFLGYLLSPAIMNLLTSDPAVLPHAISYLRWLFIGVPAMFVYMIFMTSLRSIGEVKIPLLVVLVTVILNIFLDPLLMNGWKFIPAMGVSGVALATVITQSISAIIGIIILFGGFYGVKLRITDFHMKKNLLTQLLKIGIPSSLEFSSRSLGMVLMTFVVSTLGTITVASFGIGTRILSFIIIPAVGLAIATSSLAGNNLGAKKYDRVRQIVKEAMKIGFLSLTIIGIILFIFAQHIVSFFVPGEFEVIKAGSEFIRIMALTFGFIGVQMAIFGALKAAGKTTISMVLAMFSTLMTFVGSLILSRFIGAQGIWIAYPVSNILSFILALYFYKKGVWLQKIV